MPDLSPRPVGDWFEAIGLALTGERLAITPDDPLFSAARDHADRDSCDPDIVQGAARDPAAVDAAQATAPDAASLVAHLEAAGWTPQRLQAHRAARQQAGQPWPHAEAAGLVGSLGAGQCHALLAEVRELTGLTGLHPAARQGPPVIGAAEQRLLNDRPPHHG